MLLRTIRPLLAALITALAVVGVVAPASAATGDGTVTGRIVDSAGAGVPSITLMLATGGSSAPEHPYRAFTVETDASGAFAFTGIRPGAYVFLEDEPGWVPADAWRSVIVRSGASVRLGSRTVLRAATVRGRLVSAADGSPVVDQQVFAGGPSERTDADGAFALTVRPGAVTVRTSSRFWFPTTRTTEVAEGAGADLGTVALDPAGLVEAGFAGRSGRWISATDVAAVVDGCRVTSGRPSACAGVEVYATAGSLQLRPGAHTVRYEVRSPVTGAVRRVTRSVEVQAGVRVGIGQVVFPVVDPARRAAVQRTTYRRGHAVVLRVFEGAWLDGAQPRLRVTIRVSGHVVKPTSTRWTTRANGDRVLVATLPKRLSTRASLKARVVVHGDAVHAGQTSPATRLVRTR